MADLLSKLLLVPGEPLPDFTSSIPPDGFSRHEWSLRHELPLFFINFLRDQTEPLLSIAHTTGATPGKGNRPVKYEYSSPLKTVVESPGKPRIYKSENLKKPKKKVKLFTSKVTGKVNKSFSDIEEQLEIGKLNGDGNLEGIDALPTTPARQTQSLKPEGRRKLSESYFNVHSKPEQDPRKKFNNTFSGRSSDYDTPQNNSSKFVKKKVSPSPQTFSLADFMTPAEGRKGTKKVKGSRSPSKIKSSTPIDENVVPRATNLSFKLAELDLDSADSFPEIGDLGAKKRRMKPILLSAPRTGPGAVPDNPIFGQKVERPSFHESNTDSPFKVEEVELKSVDSRQMIKEFASKLTPFKSGAQIKTPVKTPVISRSNSITNQMLFASPLLVQQKETLDLLSEIYSYIFFNNLMPNIYVEIYFLMELLLLDIPSESDGNNEAKHGSFFSSLHNCVYFACNVLAKCVSLFTYFDRTTLRLMMENDRISQFNQTLVEQLGDLYNSRTIPSPVVGARGDRSLRSHQNVSFLTVSFQSETDNRSNFPSNASFHDFKKQRDKFYSLVRKWGEHNKGKEYSFEASLGGEVEKVMTMHQHPVNYYHFARLFMAQLVAMCRGENLGEGGDESQQLMAELRKTDPLKCKKLAARLVTPGRCGGPCPAPSFSGAAEFFRDFILVCKSPQFVQHLKDLLICEIRRLNSVQFEVGEGSRWGSGISKLEDSIGLDMSETGVSELLIEQYQETLITLRIIAKFLGFLESFPYLHPGEELSEELVASAVQVREGGTPGLDVAQCVQLAGEKGRLVLTLPWVIEFLSQLDQVAPSIPYYNSLYLKLAIMYQSRLSPLAPSCCPLTAYFLSLYLGWLFEGKTFPREVLILAQVSSAPQQIVDEEHLDQLEVVTLGLVMQCCPWVGEVKTVLQQWEGGKKGSQVSLDRIEGTYRKITPLAAPLDRKDKMDKEALLQSQLEENFFHNQPKSLRRTVEYLSERLASNIIKRIRQDIVPSERSSVVEILKQSIPSLPEQADSIQTRLVGKVPQLSNDSLNKIKTSTQLLLSTTLRPDCRAALDILLASDTNPAAKNTCIAITVRTVQEKVWQWVGLHVTLAYFTREYQGEAERVSRQALKDPAVLTASLFSGKHEPEGIPPSELLITMKNHLKALLVDIVPLTLSPDCILSVIFKTKTCLSTRADLTPLAIRGFETLTLDWLLALLVMQPCNVTEKIIEEIVSLWTVLTPPQIVNILCARNLSLFTRSKDPEKSWELIQCLLVSLVQSGLLPIIALEDSCLALLQLSQLENVPNMDRLSRCLTEVAKVLDRDDMDWVNLVVQEIQDDFDSE